MDLSRCSVVRPCVSWSVCRSVRPSICPSSTHPSFIHSIHSVRTVPILTLPPSPPPPQARFCKWRAVIKVDNDTYPSSQGILENAHGLARYAAIAQANGLVPIVEPEVTLGPGDYSIERTAYVSERVYSHVFRLLNEYNVMRVEAIRPSASLSLSLSLSLSPLAVVWPTRSSEHPPRFSPSFSGSTPSSSSPT